MALEALLRSVVDARGAEGAQQVPDGSDHLVVRGAMGEAASRLPEGIVIVDEGDEVAPELTPVERPLALRLQPAGEGGGVRKALQDVPQGSVGRVALGEPEIEHGVQAEEDGVVAVLA